MMNLSWTIPFLLLGTSLVVLPPQPSTALTVPEVPGLAIASTDFPIVKSAALTPDIHVPWSRPVKVTDPFEGNFLGVFDRNDLGGYLYREGSKQVTSLWTRQNVRVLLTVNSGKYGSYYAGYLYPEANEFVNTKKVTKLLLKIQGQVFSLEGSNGTFAISDELATVLKNAPQQKLDIRLVLESGETVDSQIGKDTVRAWRTIYT